MTIRFNAPFQFFWMYVPGEYVGFRFGCIHVEYNLWRG
jgi:hypothetical protein